MFPVSKTAALMENSPEEAVNQDSRRRSSGRQAKQPAAWWASPLPAPSDVDVGVGLLPSSSRFTGGLSFVNPKSVVNNKSRNMESSAGLAPAHVSLASGDIAASALGTPGLYLVVTAN